LLCPATRVSVQQINALMIAKVPQAGKTAEVEAFRAEACVCPSLPRFYLPFPAAPFLFFPAVSWTPSRSAHPPSASSLNCPHSVLHASIKPRDLVPARSAAFGLGRFMPKQT